MKKRIEKILRENPQGLKAKEIARLLADTDRTSVNQVLYANPSLFVVNDDYEWTLKKGGLVKTTREVQWISKDEIQHIFKGIWLSPNDIARLRKIDRSTLEKAGRRFAELSALLNVSWIYCCNFDVVYDRALFTSDSDFAQIVNKTKKVNKHYRITNIKDWEQLVFCTDADVFCSQMQGLGVHPKLSTISLESKFRLAILSPKNFTSVMDNVSVLSATVGSLSANELLLFAHRKDFNRVFKQICEINALQKKKEFPALKHYGTSWQTLVLAKEEQFNMYLEHCRHLHQNRRLLLSKIENWNDWYYQRFFDVILLDNIKFKRLCDNISSYTFSAIIEQLDNKEWLAFFLQSKRDFDRSWENTQSIDVAVKGNEIAEQSIQEWKAWAWLPPTTFQTVMNNNKRQYAAFLQRQKEAERVRAELSEMLARTKDTPIKQCFGDCGSCKRDKCVLEK